MKRPYPSPYRTPKTKRTRTWGEYGKQVAAGTSAATLGYIVGNVPTALEAGMAAYEATAPNLEEDGIEDLYQAAFAEGGLPEKSKSAMYMINKNSNINNAVEKDKALCQKKGFVRTTEIYGTVKDSDIVYLTHSTYSAEYFANAIGQALTRKLLKKAGFDVSVYFQVNPPLVWNSTVTTSASTGYLFQLVFASNDGTLFTPSYAFQSGIALVDIANSLFAGQTYGFIGFLKRTLLDVDATFPNPKFLRLYQETGQSTNPYSLVAQLNLEEEKIHLISHSTITMQNRTNAASTSADSAQIFQVDQQPLVGKVFSFKYGTPRIVGDNYSQNYELERLDKNGMELIRGEQLTFSWSKAPTKSSFGNCSKVVNTSLGVGQIKSFHIVSQFSGKLNLFLAKYTAKGLNTNPNPGVPFYRYVPGKSQMIALEEEMNTGSANKVTVGYQCSKTVGCYSVTSPTPCSLEERQDIVYDNVE